MTQNVFDRQERIDGWKQSEIERQKVLVIGAGALGNEAIKALCQLGVKDVTLVDYDSIEETNLNRCVFFSASDVGKKKAVTLAQKATTNATKITPVNAKVEELGEDAFKVDFVFSCLDNLGARLHVNAQAYHQATIIDGGTFGFNGKVQVTQKPSACFECAMTKRDYSLLWKKYSCVGEPLDFLDPKMPAVSTTTSIISAMQATEFVKIVHDKPSLAGRYLFFDGLKQTTSIFEVPKRRDCPVHGGE